MAVMNKMREKMTVIFAGLAGAFLLMIIFEWGAQGDFFKGSSRKADEIGKVNGESITNKDYDDVFNQLRQQKLQEMKKSALTEAEESDLREKAWDQVIVGKIIDQKIEEFGITVTDQEVRDVLYYSPPEFLKKSFIDSTGRFDQASYFQALRDPRNDTTVSNVTKQLRDELRKQKLSSLLQTVIRTTRADMWERYDNTNSKATVELINLKPTHSPREFISKITDDEIKKYYNDHPYLYNREEGRKIKFVIFREVPTPKDSVMLMERIDGLKKKWMSLPLNASDSVLNDLAHDYTELPYQTPAVFSASKFNTYNNPDEIVATKVGDVVVGNSQGQLKVMRVLEATDTGSTAYHAKGIMIGFGRPENKDSAKALAEKLINDIKAGGSFETIARQYSQDPSARNGGDMHWLEPKMFIPEVEAVGLSAPIGVVQGPIESKMGYHIIQVIARTNRKLKIGTIPIDIRPGSQTSRMIAQQASIFREKAAKDGFDQTAQAQNLRVVADGPVVMKKGTAPMFGYMPWVNYLFDLSAGDITQPVRIPGGHITVVGQVTEVVPKGVKPLDSLIKEQIKTTLAKRKSVEALAPRAKELRAMLAPGDDLSKLSAVDSTLKSMQTTFGPAESAGAIGSDYSVNNAAFSMKVGEISQPIQGDAGYFIIKLMDLRPADKKLYDAQKTKEFETLAQEKQQRFFGQWLDELKEKAKIVDYRSHRS
jgi:peptidyl-prolyl cis-trans isomerase D